MQYFAYIKGDPLFVA